MSFTDMYSNSRHWKSHSLAVPFTAKQNVVWLRKCHFHEEDEKG